MPPEVPFQPTEEHLGYPAKMPHLDVLILSVIRDGVGKDVLHLHVHYLKTIQELLRFLLRVNIRDRAPFLDLRITRNQLINTPELSLTIDKQNPQDFPGITVVHHDLDGAPRFDIMANLLDDLFWMGCMVDNTER